MRLKVIIATLLLTAFVSADPAEAGDTLPRVASLDHCADQYVLALADRSQISALSHWADDDFSFYRDRVKGLPQTSGTIEEVLYLRPDVVIRYWGGSARMRTVLKQAGIPVLSANSGIKTNTVFENVEVFSKAFGQHKAGLEFVRIYKERLRKLKQATVGKLRAIYLSPGGTSAGLGTFGDEVLRLAGLRNAVAEMGLKGWRSLPLEALIMEPPDVIIGAFFDGATIHRSSWGILRHPVVKRMFSDIPTIFVPGRLLACRAFTFVDAAEYITGQLKLINSGQTNAARRARKIRP